MEIIYLDKRIAVVVKPAGVLSTDEPGGLPELVRKALGEENGCIRTVHRLDRPVGGLVVLARSRRAASELSRQIREGRFEKLYLAAVLGRTEDRGELRDLLLAALLAALALVATRRLRGRSALLSHIP